VLFLKYVMPHNKPFTPILRGKSYRKLLNLLRYMCLIYIYVIPNALKVEYDVQNLVLCNWKTLDSVNTKVIPCN
jgi:hypothetical protein